MACPTCLLLKAALQQLGLPEEAAASAGTIIGVPVEAEVKKKVKGKVSAYNRKYKRAYADVERKHPRMSFPRKVKLAHKKAKKM
jgi:hypothetical protein